MKLVGIQTKALYNSYISFDYNIRERHEVIA